MNNSSTQSWAIYEANVQQYRVICATVQSFLITVGALLYSTGSAPKSFLGLITIIGILHVFYIWIPIVKSRNLIVDYHKFQHEKNFNTEQKKELGGFCSEKSYVMDSVLRAEVNEKFFKQTITLWRPTRMKLDLIVPSGYVVIWIALAITKFC